jgi:hypothetical protein
MTPTVYFPPDPVDPSATRVFPKAELEATPAVTADVQDGPFELEGSTIVPMDSSHRVSQLSELEGSSRFSNRVSAMTTINGNRWSAVSSLSPSPLPSPPAKAAATAGVVPGAADLQIITQQHYGSTGQRYPPRQHSEDLHKSSSSRLPTMGETNNELCTTSSPSRQEKSYEDDRSQQRRSE